MTTTVTGTIASAPPGHSRSSSIPRTLRKNAYSSTPNLNAAYSSPFTLPDAPPVPTLPRLPRKSSFSALTYRSLSPRSSDGGSDSAYVLDPVLSADHRIGMPLSPPRKMALPATPGKLLSVADDGSIGVGDIVNVPGNMHGTVKFVGSVAGKKGVFAGVELHPEFAAKGKNDGDVDGTNYFTTTVAGAGIFLPVTKASRRSGPASPIFPPATPTSLRTGAQNYTAYTPPTSSVSKFSASVGPDSRRPRAALSRPESPVRRLNAPPTNRPSVGGAGVRVSSRYSTTPIQNRFAQSVRGTSGHAKTKTAPRSNSALGEMNFDEDEPLAPPRRTGTNGSSGSMSRTRPGSQVHDGTELGRLRAQIEERDRQLEEQAATLAEMEASLAEVQSLMENPETMKKRGSLEDKKAQQLRAMVREKNEKISILTAEFDAHRADFRSTIDALETASTETQKLYEKRIEELTLEIKELEATRMDSLDVNSVAIQLRQLEELVQELEEGLEDARRGEAEARGEVEFLRGEVERTRAELRREREKAAAAANGSKGSSSKELEQKEDEIRGLKAIIHSLSRDSVPSGPIPSGPIPSERQANGRSGSIGSHKSQQQESPESRQAREKLETEIAELQSMLDNKNNREEQLEKEIETLRRASVSNSTNRGSAITTRSSRASSLRESRDMPAASNGGNSSRQSQSSFKRGMPTMETMAESDANSTTATETSAPWCDMCETSGHDVLSCNKFGDFDLPAKTEGRGRAESHNSIKNRHTMTSPHDDERDKNGLIPLRLTNGHSPGPHARAESHDIKPLAPLSPVKSPVEPCDIPAVLSVPTLPPSTLPPSTLPPAMLPPSPPAPTPATIADPAPEPEPVAPLANKFHIIPNPMESGPVAGKESGVVDESKWCALCERDGHESVDCPFEDAF